MFSLQAGMCRKRDQTTRQSTLSLLEANRIRINWVNVVEGRKADHGSTTSGDTSESVCLITNLRVLHCWISRQRLESMTFLQRDIAVHE